MRTRKNPLKIGIAGMLLSAVIGSGGSLVGNVFGNYYNHRYQETKSTEDLDQARMYFKINYYSLIGTTIAVSGCALSSLGAHIYREIKGGGQNGR